MPGFNQSESKFAIITQSTQVSISDHLTKLNAAYRADDRIACMKMIDDLYEFFDQYF